VLRTKCFRWGSDKLHSTGVISENVAKRLRQ
jgi:hypothetical protein